MIGPFCCTSVQWLQWGGRPWKPRTDVQSHLNPASPSQNPPIAVLTTPSYRGPIAHIPAPKHPGISAATGLLSRSPSTKMQA